MTRRLQPLASTPFSPARADLPRRRMYTDGVLSSSIVRSRTIGRTGAGARFTILSGGESLEKEMEVNANRIARPPARERMRSSNTRRTRDRVGARLGNASRKRREEERAIGHLFVLGQVFPELHEWCEARRLHFLATDLHWVRSRGLDI